MNAAEVRQQVSDNLRPATPGNLEQQLDRDLQTINTIFARWAPLAENPDHHALLVRYVERLLTSVETLTEALQT